MRFVANWKRGVLGVVRVGGFGTPRLSICTHCARTRLLGGSHLRSKLFVTRDPGIVKQTLSTKCVPVSILIRGGRVRRGRRARRILTEFRGANASVFATRFTILARLAKFGLAEKVLYTLGHQPLRSFEGLYRKGGEVTVLRSIVGPAGIKTVFQSTTTVRVSTILLASKYDGPLCQETSEIDVKAIFRVP